MIELLVPAIPTVNALLDEVVVFTVGEYEAVPEEVSFGDLSIFERMTRAEKTGMFAWRNI